ncbi:MAG: class I SAM-dependent methyltransferase [Candidatus Magasanikbacteria bacterium]|nr:class I SAM-dependent methyltransferase [Candidatus Magasanikbacteria bacterium]
MSQLEPKKLIEQNRDVYDTIAPLFSATREYNWADVEVLAEYIKPGDKVLDLGCGNGRLYQILAKKQALYTGLDQSGELIALAREKAPEVEFVVGEMTELSFDAASFDAIFSIAAFNHIPGAELQLKSLQEMKRVLKPGGLIVMTNWNLLSDSAQKNIAKHGWKVLQQSAEAGIDVMVPWKSPTGETLGERYYHGFTVSELTNLANATDLQIVDLYFGHKGERLDQAAGANVISVFRK